MWASIEMDLLCIDKPKECWGVVLNILSRTNDEWVLTNLAAGPVESLLANHGEMTICWIEDEAKKNQRFRMMLGDVWRNLISDEVWQRIQRVK
jgi:hypothetical protein